MPLQSGYKFTLPQFQIYCWFWHCRSWSDSMLLLLPIWGLKLSFHYHCDEDRFMHLPCKTDSILIKSLRQVQSFLNDHNHTHSGPLNPVRTLNPKRVDWFRSQTGCIPGSSASLLIFVLLAFLRQNSKFGVWIGSRKGGHCRRMQLPSRDRMILEINTPQSRSDYCIVYEVHQRGTRISKQK